MSSSSSKVFKVLCPRCGTPAEFSPANPNRPFCTERCRMIDLGQWANEDYRVPTRENSDSLEEGTESEGQIEDLDS